MADTKKDRIVLKVAKTLLTVRADDGVCESMAVLGRELKLDGAFILRTSEIPFLFELKYLWEPEKNIEGKSLLLDVSGAPDWGLFDPYSEGEKGKELIADDLSKIELGPITLQFVTNLGINSAVTFLLKAGKEFLGFIVFFGKEARSWTESEVATLREASECIATEIDVIRMEDARADLMSDYDKRINDSSDAKNQFITNLSHEIRTPVNAVVGMISIMRHNVGSPDIMEECLDRMEKSTKFLVDVVNDCVDMTLINDREMQVTSSWIPLSLLIAGVERVIAPLAAARNQHVEFDYDETMSVFGDEIKLSRALVSSITNSCHTAENDTNICLTIKCEKLGGKDAVTFRIRDEVAGMDSETVKRIFEPFGGERFHDVFRGTGLGMVITKHLVELMNGTVEFFSDGWGTELVMGIPLQTRGGKHDEASPVQAPESGETNELAELYIGRRVLIAEDNVLMGEILATILGYRGLETDIALNGQEAFDRFTCNDPFYYDMILMDIQMPVMDGIAAARAIRGSGRADSELIPIAALSANGFEEDIKIAMDAGMNTYLRKPVGDKELFDTISNLIL